MFFAYIFIDYFFLKKAFKKYGRVDYALTQRRQAEILCDKRKALDYAVEALHYLKGIRHIEVDRLQSIVEAETRLFWRNSFAEIKVQVHEGISGKSVISITSKPLRKTALFDEGRNFINVESILAAISKKVRVMT